MQTNRKRILLLLAVFGALSLGLSDALPVGERVSRVLGIRKAEGGFRCPNTDCLGSADCEYLKDHICYLQPLKCSVENCTEP